MNVVINGRITTGPKFFFHETTITFLIPLCLLSATGLLCEQWSSLQPPQIKLFHYSELKKSTQLFNLPHFHQLYVCNVQYLPSLSYGGGRGFVVRSELSEKKGTDYSPWEVSGQSEEALDQRGEAGAQKALCPHNISLLCLLPRIMWVPLCVYPTGLAAWDSYPMSP